MQIVSSAMLADIDLSSSLGWIDDRIAFYFALGDGSQSLTNHFALGLGYATSHPRDTSTTLLFVWGFSKEKEKKKKIYWKSEARHQALVLMKDMTPCIWDARRRCPRGRYAQRTPGNRGIPHLQPIRRLSRWAQSGVTVLVPFGRAVEVVLHQNCNCSEAVQSSRWQHAEAAGSRLCDGPRMFILVGRPIAVEDGPPWCCGAQRGARRLALFHPPFSLSPPTLVFLILCCKSRLEKYDGRKIGMPCQICSPLFA